MGGHLSDAEYKSQVRAVWKATLWLSIITIVEVVAALIWPESAPKMPLNIFFILASLLKAYFIVGEFMHVKYETRALAITILAPTIFLVWFVIAFLWEGGEWLNLREYWGVIDPNAVHAPTPADHGHGGGGHH